MIVTSARAKMNPREFVEIKDLKLGMKHISLHVIILDVGKNVVYLLIVITILFFEFSAFRLSNPNQRWK